MARLTACPSWGRRAGGTGLGQWSHRMMAGAEVLATATMNGASVLIARARVGLQQRERTGERERDLVCCLLVKSDRSN